RHQVIATLGQQATWSGGGAAVPRAPTAEFVATSHPAMPLDRLDGASKRALARAYWEAGRANEEEVMPHHLLLALVANEEVWIRRVLTQVSVDLTDLVARIDAASPPRTGPRPLGIFESRALMAAI